MIQQSNMVRWSGAALLLLRLAVILQDVSLYLELQDELK